MLRWVTYYVLLICELASWNGSNHDMIYQQSAPSNMVCSVTADAGPDTVVCFPAGYIQLSGSITGDEDMFMWTPPDGLTDPTILNPLALVTAPITYTLTVVGHDPSNQNIIFNGDFELGNVGFTSSYTYVADTAGIQTEMVEDSTYTVTHNPNLFNDTWPSCMDHTEDPGMNMLLVNGSNGNGNNDTIWCQVISVSPNTYYALHTQITAVNQTAPPYIFASFGEDLFGLGQTASNLCTWAGNYPAIWYSEDVTEVELCLIIWDDWFGAWEGVTDFAIDDITLFELCVVQDEVEITLIDDVAPIPEIIGPITVCNNDLSTYSVSFPPGIDILHYEWSLPSGGIITTGQGTDQITVRWNETGDFELCLSIETFCNSNEGCINVEVNDEPAANEISGPLSLCPGQMGTLSVLADAAIDQYNWIIPSGIEVLNGQGTSSLEIQWVDLESAEICIEMSNECGLVEDCFSISLSPAYVTLIDTALCTGQTITVNGNTYGDGTWTGTEYFTSFHGCDSVVEINIMDLGGVESMVTEYMCFGDSIYLEGEYQTEHGIYIDSFTTMSGCDSVIFTELIVSQSDSTWITSNTCVPGQAGTTITVFDLGNCDSVVINEVFLVASDTTILSIVSCSPSDTGQTTQVLMNAAGCDSVVLTSISLVSSVTTELFKATCDPLQAGISVDTLIAMSGCDSVIMTHHLLETDTILISRTTCDTTQVGVITILETNQFGCDSLIITTTTYLQSDTTLVFLESCSALDTGVTSIWLLNVEGCDSLVIEQITYSGSDTMYLTESSCTSSDTGITVTQLSNQFGCDSIIVLQIELSPSDTTYLYAASCSAQDTGVFLQHLTNVHGCDSLIINTVSLEPPEDCFFNATLTVQQPQCFGDTAWLNVDIQEGLGPFELQLDNNGSLFNYNYPLLGIYSIPLEMINGALNIQLVSANGLIIYDTVFIEIPQPFLVELIQDSDHNGYGVGCHGDSTGKAHVNILSGGHPPFSYQWSNGLDTPDATNLSAGTYSITVTDNRSCSSSSELIISEPASLNFDIVVDDVLCTGHMNGVVVTSIAGGVMPWMIFLDGNAIESGIEYNDLESGIHHLVVIDQNDCTVDSFFSIAESTSWIFELGPDTIIPTGTTLEIEGIIYGEPTGNVEIVWSDGQCENCLSRTLQPNEYTTLIAVATDEEGCSSVDTINIYVSTDRSIFIPNIFSPNGDQNNDRFTITPGIGLKEIEELVIFDRWGNMMFQRFNFFPEDPSDFWDGQFKGENASIGVYAYKLIFVFEDLRTEIRTGDLTLVR